MSIDSKQLGDEPAEMSVPTAKPAIRYTVDLNHVYVVTHEVIQTVSGVEENILLEIPPKGCSHDCAFCSLKHRENKDFPVLPHEGNVLGATKNVVDEIAVLLDSHPTATTLTLSNAGNILHGTEWKKGAELHEMFWIPFLEMIQKRGIQAVEIEVRVDEFSDNTEGKESRPKKIVRDRLLWLSEQLQEMGKCLRCILPLEYAQSSILEQQRKFPSSLISNGKAEETFQHAISCMNQYRIEWLGYAMLGGRLANRSLQREEAIDSAAHTVLFGLEHGAREVIINCQYVDPINQWEAQRDGIPFFIPSERDMIETLGLIVAGMSEIGKDEVGAMPRVRIVPEPETTIADTVGPTTSPQFLRLISRFNNAPDQVAFFGEYMGNMTYSEEESG